MQHTPGEWGNMIRAHQKSAAFWMCSSPQATKTVKLNICPAWDPQTAYFSNAQNCQFHPLCNHHLIHTEHYVTDCTSCPIYLDCISLSAGYLVSTVLVAAGSNRRFWLLHALLVIMIVTIITLLISETVEQIVIVIACLVVECVPFFWSSHGCLSQIICN